MSFVVLERKKEVSMIFEHCGWSFIDWQPPIGMLSFRRGKTRVNVYLTKMTVCAVDTLTGNHYETLKRASIQDIKQYINKIIGEPATGKKEISVESILEIMNKHIVKRKAAEEILGKYTGEEGIYLTHGYIRGSEALEAMEEYAEQERANVSGNVAVDFANWIVKKGYKLNQINYSNNGGIWFLNEESTGQTSIELFLQYEKDR